MLSKKDKLKQYLNIKGKESMIKELNEAQILELIKTGSNIVLKVWLTNCSFCKRYEPIFEKISKEDIDPSLTFAAFNLSRDLSNSEFARLYMMENGAIKAQAPATMLFSEGQLRGRHYGLLEENALRQFVKTGQVEGDKKQKAQVELGNLFAEKGAIITAYEKLPEINKKIAELQQILLQG